jgi:hypothetical protein
MQNRDTDLVLVLFASLVFCAAILYSGTRRQKIWNPVDWTGIDRRTSPWNYRVAVFIWSLSLIFVVAGLVIELWKFLR